MTFIASLRRDWLANPRVDILAGIVVALALIPEAIGFSIIAGVDPRVGLYASVSIAIVIAFTGGRPGMISAATAAVDQGLPERSAEEGRARYFNRELSWLAFNRTCSRTPATRPTLCSNGCGSFPSRAAISTNSSWSGSPASRVSSCSTSRKSRPTA